ncbi:universal stress protein [Blastococcus atacamensis]|uniref:universal stress protein n=1 Tax=Blastococcus atacamensis TaxID=2070508 RepID=UPI0018E48922|nr:universal stress protein [Blastococcus atacamensis]
MDANDTRPSDELASRPRVVVGVDGSAGSRSALGYAMRAAVQRGADLDVVSSYAPDLYWMGGAPVAIPDMGSVRDDIEKRVLDMIGDVRSDVEMPPGTDTPPFRTNLILSPEPPAAELLRRSRDGDLLVVGSRGRGAVRSALLGSVALHCVTHAPCPVVVVHPTVGEPGGTPRVVVGVDGSDAARAAFAAAIDEAVQRNSELDVVATYAVVDYWTDLYSVVIPSVDEIRSDARRAAEEQVTSVLQERPMGSAAPVVRIEAVEGAASDVLVERARGADLLVVGSRGRGAVRALLLGSVALHCAMHAPGAVMVVHPQRSGPAKTQEAADHAQP